MAHMPAMSSEEVVRLASLARIELTEAEVARIAGEFDAILDAVASVSAVATEDVPATSHPIPMTNVFRKDEVTETLTQDEALLGAPEAADGRFVVPQILGEE